MHGRCDATSVQEASAVAVVLRGSRQEARAPEDDGRRFVRVDSDGPGRALEFQPWSAFAVLAKRGRKASPLFPLPNSARSRVSFSDSDSVSDSGGVSETARPTLPCIT